MTATQNLDLPPDMDLDLAAATESRAGGVEPIGREDAMHLGLEPTSPIDATLIGTSPTSSSEERRP